MPTEVDLEGLPELLKSSQVAEIFGVSARAVSQWAITGKIKAIRTPGGQHRYSKDEVMRILAGIT